MNPEEDIYDSAYLMAEACNLEWDYFPTYRTTHSKFAEDYAAYGYDMDDSIDYWVTVLESFQVFGDAFLL